MNWYARAKIAMPYGPKPDYVSGYFSIGHKDDFRDKPNNPYANYQDRPEATAWVWSIGQDAKNQPPTFKVQPQGYSHMDVRHAVTFAKGRFEVNNKNPEGVTWVAVETYQLSPQEAAWRQKQVQQILDRELPKLNGGKPPTLIDSEEFYK